MEKAFRYQLQHLSQEFESRPKSQPDWASKAKNFDTMIDRMDDELNKKANNLRTLN